MAKGINNEFHRYGPTGLGKILVVDHIKKCLDIEGYENGSEKVLKMDKFQASYLKGVYDALDLLVDLWATTKDEEAGTALITNLLSDEWFADYIVDHYAFQQKLSPSTYRQFYEQEEKDNNLINV